MKFVCLIKLFAYAMLGLWSLQGLPAYAQISAKQVYEQPDNHELNLEYAKQQILKGEMLDAGSALERMLYANPNWHSARLLYAAVLYRLDDQQAALRELSLLEDKQLNTEQLAKLENYKTAFLIPPQPITPGVSARVSADLDQGASFRSRDKVQGQLSLHFRGDDNAGNALTDESFGFRDEGDVSAVISGRVRTFQPVSENVTIRSEFGGQIRRHQTFSDVDFDVFDASTGLTIDKSRSVAAIDIDARKINISGETYLKQIGPRLTLSRKISPKTYTNFSLSAYKQDYDVIENASLEDERDGYKLTFQAGILHKIDQRNKIRLAVAFEDKSAAERAFAYQGPSLALAYDHKADKNFYLKARGKIRKLDYSGSLTESFDREETRFNGRLAVGKYLDINHGSLKSASIEAGANLTRRNSNIQANAFENFGVDVRLSAGF